MRVVAIGLLLLALPARADVLEFPPVVERSGEVIATYRIDPPRPGTGTLALDWTDALGRTVQRSSIAVPDTAGAAVPVRINVARAVAMRNTLDARLTRGGVTTEARASFIASPPAGPWNDFVIVMYQEHAGRKLAGLRALGVTGAKVLGFRVPFTDADLADRIARPLDADMRWYVENIATDFYAAYHRWTPEHPQEVNYLFNQVQARHRQNPADLAVFERTPSLSDAAWLARIRDRLIATVRANRAYRPFYYSLADEPGIADLAAAWDFDRAPPALAAFRTWLRARYPTLAALNATWSSAFANWDDVLPETTTAAMARTDDNYAAWNDHKAFMDESFAAALRAGTDAVHAADPLALAAIEGGQIPGWGGWDYGRLANAVDVLEMYDTTNNVAISRSLNPDLIMLSTSFGGGPADRRGLWRLVLQGMRGFIIWDDADDVAKPDGSPGPRGVAMAPLFGELRNGLGALLIASPTAYDPVAVLHSPASFRLSWLLQYRAQGDGWTERNSERENEDTPVRIAERQAASDLANLGMQPRWLTPELLAGGALQRLGIRLLVLPQAIALSGAEVAAINEFSRAGGTVLTDGPAGPYDGHLRRRTSPALAAATPIPTEGRLQAVATALTTALGHPPRFAASPAPPASPAVTLRANGGVTLLGVESGGDASIPEQHEIDLPAPAYVRDIRAGGPWEFASRIRIHLDGEGPALLAIAPAPLPRPSLAMPTTAQAGKTADLHLALAGPTPAATTILHVTVRDPAGRPAPPYSGNAILRPDTATWHIPFAVSDPPGDWTVTIHDLLSGTTIFGTLTLRAAPPP